MYSTFKKSKVGEGGGGQVDASQYTSSLMLTRGVHSGYGEFKKIAFKFPHSFLGLTICDEPSVIIFHTSQ